MLPKSYLHLHFHQPCRKYFFHISPLTILSLFKIIASLIGLKWFIVIIFHFPISELKKYICWLFRSVHLWIAYLYLLLICFLGCCLFLVNFKSFLHIITVFKPLSVICSTNMFSESIICLLSLFIVYSATQQFFIRFCLDLPQKS